MVATHFITHALTKSVLQCFCRTCQVPNVEKKVISPPPRTTSTVVRRPPKKIAFLATEVKCSEQSKGGLKYELVLQPPTVESPKHVTPTLPKCNLSKEDIEKKLKAAEERRLSRELEKLTFVTEKLSNLPAVNAKKEEYNSNFMQSTKENLEQKLESVNKNRETHIKTVQEKAREIVQKVEEKRKLGDSPDKEIKLEAINKKLLTAQEKREAILKSLQEKLREHDNHILEIKKEMEEKNENQLVKISKKLEIAEVKRESMLKEIQEKSKEHIFKIRQMNELNQLEIGNKLNQIQNKLTNAERNRASQVQAMLGKLQEHERHCEVVRQKAMSMSEESCKENFSG